MVGLPAPCGAGRLVAQPVEDVAGRGQGQGEWEGTGTRERHGHVVLQKVEWCVVACAQSGLTALKLGGPRMAGVWRIASGGVFPGVASPPLVNATHNFQGGNPGRLVRNRAEMEGFAYDGRFGGWRGLHPPMTNATHKNVAGFFCTATES